MSDKEPMTKERLAEAMQSLFAGIQKENNHKAVEDPLYIFLADKSKWLGDPETMDVMIVNRFNNIIEQLVIKTFAPHADDMSLAVDIYTHWDIFCNLTTRFCEALYGSTFCADRSRFIIKSVMKQKITRGEFPTLKPLNKENYHHPPTGEWEQWAAYIYGIDSLIYGRPSNFILAMGELLKTINR